MPSNKSESHVIEAAVQLNAIETFEPSLLIRHSRFVRIWKLCLISNVMCTVGMVIFVAVMSTSFFHSLGKTYPRCLSGEPGCQKLNEGYTKIIVANGWNGSFISTVEVIDISGRNLVCNDLPLYPKATSKATGGLLGTTPVICGGKHEAACYALVKDKWILMATMSANRWYSAGAVVGNKMLVTGGYIKLDTSDLVGLDTSKPGPKLPRGVYHHCAVAVNESTIMIIGGAYHGLPRTTTHYYNLDIDHWIKGPDLKAGRYKHSCAAIQSNGVTVVVVAGGWNDMSVELLQTGGASEWSYGTPLPVKITAGQLVPDATGNGVFMIGGYDYANVNHLDAIYHMACVDCEWVKVTQRLKTARRSHVAIPVPQDLVTCQ